MARGMLTGMIPHADLAMAISTTATAFAAARSAARDPAPFDETMDPRNPEGRASMGRAIVQAALTRIFPGGVAPLAYLVPQRDRRGDPWKIRYNLSHRGAALLASEEDWAVVPVPVHVEDGFEVQFGEVVEHRPCGRDPTTLDDLAGVYLSLRRRGVLVSRPWLSTEAILSRRDRSRAKDSGPWVTDPVPMAQKTAIHYCVARGILPLRSAAAREAIGAGEEVVHEEASSEPSRAGRPARRQIAAPVDEDPGPGQREREPAGRAAAEADEEAP